MRILFVGMSDSIHIARWISQVVDQDWEIYLFPSYGTNPRPEFRQITIFGASPVRSPVLSKSVCYVWWTFIYYYLDILEKQITHKYSNKYKKMALAQVIRIIKPDIVHSIEFQSAAYLTLEAKNELGDAFPVWIVTNWGSDIFLFGRLASHKERVRQILLNCDYYLCECERDVFLAKKMGLKGKVLPRFIGSSGFDVDRCIKLQSVPPSLRKGILLKGYQHWAGRALVALEALRRCESKLEGYTIIIYSATEDVKIAAELFTQDTNIPIEVVSEVTHEEMLRYYGVSRIYIGLSISDGLSNSMLEAMVMGTFPIQSSTVCNDGWISDGLNGFLVPAEDPDEIAKAIRQAVEDNHLVDSAAQINIQIMKEKADKKMVQDQVIQIYQDIFSSKDS